MGIGEWSRLTITENSVYCRQENIKSGEYLIMYDTLTSRLLIKDQKTDKIVYQKSASSLNDLVSALAASLPSTTDSKLLEKLKRGGKSGTKEFPNHHIIPVHLWKDYNLIIEACKLGFDMNGEDNMMRMPSEIHKKCHDEYSQYSNIIRHHLRDRWNALVEADLENDRHEIRDALISLIDALRSNLEDVIEEEGYMNNL